MTTEFAPGTIGYYAAHPEECHPETSTYGTCFMPQDTQYNYGLKNPRNPHAFTWGVMEHLIAHLDGARVTLVGEHGSTRTGVRLLKIECRYGGQPVVVFEMRLPSGETHRTTEYVQHIRCIITEQGYDSPADRKPDQFTFGRYLAAQRQKAIDLGRAKMEADPTSATYRYGAVDARPSCNFAWTFTYTAAKNAPADENPGKDWWTTVVVNP
jgi:hypothetical protein